LRQGLIEYIFFHIYLIFSYIKQEFHNPPLIGLQNIGGTQCMNAILQCFCHITKLVNYVKYKPYINDVILKYRNCGRICLTRSFKELVDNLWPSSFNNLNIQNAHQNNNNKYYAPYNFKDKISEMHPSFQEVQENHLTDLVSFIIMNLHEELNKSPENQDSNNINKIIDQTNEEMVLSNFVSNFQKEYKSIISDLFCGVSETCAQCSTCKITKYNFQVYFFLIFSLVEVRKYKIQNLNNNFKSMNKYMMNINPILYNQNLSNFNLNIQNTSSIYIYECFDYNQKVEYLTEENSIYCDRCRARMPSSYTEKLYILPEILIIFLNREDEFQNSIKLEFTEELNLNQYVVNKDTNYNYKLIGVVSHLGETDNNRHFISYCKNPIDDIWYKYNDDIVSKIENLKRDIKDNIVPDFLFFQKQE